MIQQSNTTTSAWPYEKSSSSNSQTTSCAGFVSSSQGPTFFCVCLFSASASLLKISELRVFPTPRIASTQFVFWVFFCCSRKWSLQQLVSKMRFEPLHPGTCDLVGLLRRNLWSSRPPVYHLQDDSQRRSQTTYPMWLLHTCNTCASLHFMISDIWMWLVYKHNLHDVQYTLYLYTSSIQ